MNVFKFLSATLLAGICLFSGCKKKKINRTRKSFRGRNHRK